MFPTLSKSLIFSNPVKAIDVEKRNSLYVVAKLIKLDGLAFWKLIRVFDRHDCVVSSPKALQSVLWYDTQFQWRQTKHARSIFGLPPSLACCFSLDSTSALCTARVSQNYTRRVKRLASGHSLIRTKRKHRLSDWPLETCWTDTSFVLVLVDTWF